MTTLAEIIFVHKVSIYTGRTTVIKLVSAGFTSYRTFWT